MLQRLTTFENSGFVGVRRAIQMSPLVSLPMPCRLELQYIVSPSGETTG